MSVIKKVLLTHPGTQYSYQLAVQLHRKKLLYKFVTGFAVRKKSGFHWFLQRLAPQQLSNKIANRIIALPKNKLKQYPFIEIRALQKLKKAQATNALFFQRNEQFQHTIGSDLLKSADIVISFDTASLVLQERAKKLNKICILDLSIAHSKTRIRIFNEITQQHPQWLTGVEEKAAELLAIEQQELEQAHAIVVASEFSKQSLLENGIPANKIHVNPYGVNCHQFAPKEKYRINKKIRFVFVGRVDARKGVAWLMETMQQMPLDTFEVELVGVITEDFKQYIESFGYSNVIITGKVPHTALPEILRKADVFLFPSFFEGFGLVIPEAMSCGLPVITTTATCGPDVITEGEEGYVIEPGNNTALITAMNYFIHNPSLIEKMGKKARATAEQLTWDAYGDRWNKIIDTLTD